MKRHTFFKKIISFIILSIPMLSGCSSSPKISGDYYLYDNDGHHMDTYIKVTGSTWEDQSGNSGNFSYTQTSNEISKETYKIQFKSNDSTIYSATYCNSGDYLFNTDSLGIYTYYSKEGSVPPNSNYNLPNKVTNKEDFIKVLNSYINPRFASSLYKYDIMNDIDLEGMSLFSGATTSNEYRIYINGRGHTIKNFNINSASYAGLFASITKSKIINLNIANATIYGERSGAIAGNASASIIENVTIESDVRVGDGSKPFAGGVVGLATEATEIRNCTNKGTINGAGTSGGIVGKAHNSSVIGCNNEGEVNTYIDGGCGGIVGYYHEYWESYSDHTEYLENNTNYGTVNGRNYGNIGGIVGNIYRDKPNLRFIDDSSPLAVANCVNYGTVLGYTGVGGVAGVATSKDGIETIVSFTNCSNKGTVTGYSKVGGVLGAGQANNKFNFCTNDYNEEKNNGVFGCYYVGGIAGLGNIFSSCSNNGLVAFVKAEKTLDDHSNQDYLGGIAGDTYSATQSIVMNCKNTGVVKGYYDESISPLFPRYVGHNVGGIFGLSGGGKMTNCQSTGGVYGTTNIGGLIGYVVPTFTTSITDCEVSGTLGTYFGTSIGGFIGKLAYSSDSSSAKHYTNAFSLSNCVIKDFTAKLNNADTFGYCIGSAYSSSTSTDNYGHAVLRDCEVDMDIASNKEMTIKSVANNSSLKDVLVLTVELDSNKIKVRTNVGLYSL